MQVALHPVGWELKSHRHNFSHVTIVVHGAYRVGLYEDAAHAKPIWEREIEAPAWFDVPADAFHSAVCIKPGAILCVFASREEESPHRVSMIPTGFWQASGLAP
ncbi:MAG TPA: hypothetical protein VGV37_06470 [Aliidongia sp.]|uniref:hypothetical protein n=1 Tax=Aliidongia sp. TaxID=1914230 RepID=UPI002DDCE2CF|nr:hypothetical protein [Aliidongia sp.]HEV2674170.1 hypothetical protein [Aliidongia sp.]